MTAAIRVLVVDDQQLLRRGLVMLFGTVDDIDVVAQAAHGAEALAVLRTGRIDVVLADAKMPVMDGIELVRQCARAHPDLPVLVLTTFDEEELVLAALRAGANGFLLKDASAQVLLEAVRTVARGGSWLDPAVTGTVLAHLGAGEGGAGSGETVATTPGSGPGMGPKPNASGPASAMDATRPTGAEIGANGLFEPLTGRERDVLSLVCDGLPNAEIGERLHLAESTVKTHVKALLAKTGCRNRVELIVHAFRHGLVAVR